MTKSKKYLLNGVAYEPEFSFGQLDKNASISFSEDLSQNSSKYGITKTTELQEFDQDRKKYVKDLLSEPHKLRRIVHVRDRVQILGGQVIQRVIDLEECKKYLEEGRLELRSFVASYDDTKHLKTSEQVVDGLGLAYKGTPFVKLIDDEKQYLPYYVIRTLAISDVTAYRIPYSGQDEESRQAMSDFIEGRYTKKHAGEPFTGHGFTSCCSHVVPEYYIDPTTSHDDSKHYLQDGDEMFLIETDGEETLFAVFVSKKWVKVEVESDAT